MERSSAESRCVCWRPGRGVRDRYRMEHRRTITDLEEGTAQASCSCGWRSAVFGLDKTGGTMDALQQATDAADLHEWDVDLS